MSFLTEKKYSIAEAARELQVAQRTVRRYIIEGRLEALRYTSRKQVITQSAIETFFQNSKKRAIAQQSSLN